jgi:hypothetical protein
MAEACSRSYEPNPEAKWKFRSGSFTEGDLRLDVRLAWQWSSLAFVHAQEWIVVLPHGTGGRFGCHWRFASAVPRVDVHSCWIVDGRDVFKIL